MEPILFSCWALDAAGEEVHVTIQAANKDEVIAQLKTSNLYPKKIEVLQDVRYNTPHKGQRRKPLPFAKFFKETKVPAKSMMIFIRQLSTLLDAGLPLLRSLSMLESQQQEGLLKDVLGQLGQSIQSGETLSDALTHYPLIFNRLFVKMVKAGELGGVLNIVLDRLAEFTEKGHKLKMKVKSAMMYPAIVLSIAITIVTGLLIFIVPKFEKIFTDVLGGRPLPFLTRMVIGSSNAIKDNFLIIALVIGAGYPLVAFLLKKPRVIHVVDRCLYWMPLFGPLVRMSAIAHFTRTLGTLVLSGVPILQALNSARETSGNTVLGDAITLIHQSIKEGESINLAMKNSDVFPSMVVGMVAVGEETGSLPKMLLKIADFYDDEVDATVGGLTTLMEPIMIVLLALLIGTIVVALFLPLIGIVSGMQEM
jgi:type IV pilus assembly protein PilC